MARPTVFTPETLSKLEEAFKIGATDTEACRFADISRESYYSKRKDDLEFSDKMDRAKEFSVMAAKKTVVKAVLEGDKQSAQWWLERKKKDEFAQRTELTGAEGTPLGYAYSSDIKQIATEEPKQLPDGA